MWPESGYIFNENLSKCENGGILTWDDENKKVFLSEMKHYTDFCTSSEGLIDIFTGKKNNVDIADRNAVLKYLQDIGIGN